MSYTRLTLSLLLVMVFGVMAFAQEAKVKVKVSPPQAYVFLDGTPIGDHSRDLVMSPGKHSIGVYNYGFTPQIQQIEAQPGKNPTLTFNLSPKGENVNGPWGIVQIEGAPRAAILMNGKTPDYFVGHGDMFDNHIGWKQQLVMPVGTHQLTVSYRGQQLFSGPVTVEQNQRVILDVRNGRTRTQTWSDGAKQVSRPRFQAGSASALVVVAPVSGQFAATPGQIYCNDPAKLAWSSTETIDAGITTDAATKAVPPASGEETVSPRHATTYDFVATGPGGVVKQSQTINVNPAVESSLTSSKPEVHYLKIGDQVLTNEKTELNWTTAHADAIALQPLGTVGTNGTREVAPEPAQMQMGKVDETKTYTLTSTNVCGGSDTKTASVHLLGLIQPVHTSVFFPTGYPDRRHPHLGLVASQRQELDRVAQAFVFYMEHNPEAKLTILGYTDPRDTARANMKLSERRVNRVKAYLVAKGVPAEKIQIEALGKSKVLDRETVAQLEAQHPASANEGLSNNPRTRWLAYNRRVDIVMMPVALESMRQYPHEATDARILWQAGWPARRQVEKAQ